MKYILAASALIALTAADWPSGDDYGNDGDRNGNKGGNSGPQNDAEFKNGWGGGRFNNVPSCVIPCYDSARTTLSGNDGCSDARCFCAGDSVSSMNECIDSGDCAEADKTSAYAAIATACAYMGETLTSGPQGTVSVTGSLPFSASSWLTQTTAPPFAPFLNNPSNNDNGPPGWRADMGHGPFGPYGPGSRGGKDEDDLPDNGYGPWASDSTGAWTSGPWTSWWGGSACPPGTWSGWTEGDWASQAPWTSWSGCQASTTGSSVLTTTVTGAAEGGMSASAEANVVTTTAFGVEVAAASGNLDDAEAGQQSEGGAVATEGSIGAAVAMVGVLAEALLL